MTRFTKALRQEIISEFSTRHNGHYNPHLFVEEVRATGRDHPAYEWFEWDDDKAAKDHRVWQARQFASGLRVTFTVEEAGPSGPIRVRESSAPLMVSPGGTRRQGGGYVLMDPDDPRHMGELCRQAAVALASWLQRYEGALTHAGCSLGSLRKQQKALERAAAEPPADAA